jgi:DNA-binding protein HU-beta
MDRNEMIEGIMKSAGISKANVNRFYDGLVALAKKRLASESEFVLPGLGVLRVKTLKAREGRNPRTGEKIQIERKKAVRFAAYKDLKALLNPHLASKLEQVEAEEPEAVVTEEPEIQQEEAPQAPAQE